MHRATTYLSIFLASAFLLAGCAFFAKSPVGQAIQIADYQQRVIVASARQVKGMCEAQPPKLTPATCDSAKTAYGKWRAAQITAANAIATWKAVSIAGSETAELKKADTRVRAALDELEPLAKSALELYRAFVDVPAIEKQVVPGVAPAPTSYEPVETWLALERAR